MLIWFFKNIIIKMLGERKKKEKEKETKKDTIYDQVK